MLVAFGRDKFRKAFRFLSRADPAAKGQDPILQTVVKKFARTTFATAHPNWVGFWQRPGIALRRPFKPLPRRRAYVQGRRVTIIRKIFILFALVFALVTTATAMVVTTAMTSDAAFALATR